MFPRWRDVFTGQAGRFFYRRMAWLDRSLIVGLFNDGVRVYEPHNSGWWYDFGFYVAVIGGFGGIALFRKKSGKS
jgi:hypothetical protein